MSKALSKLSERISRCERALNELRQCNSSTAARSAWNDFLVPAHAFYEIMRKAVKDDPKARQWFGGIDKLRKSDEPLAYMHHARNSEEHSLEQTTDARNCLSLGFPPGYSRAYSINSFTAENGKVIHCDMTSLDGLPLPEIWFPDQFTLVDVIDDRSGNTYRVPETHLGKKLPDSEPVRIAALMLKYLKTLLEEFETKYAPKP